MKQSSIILVIDEKTADVITGFMNMADPKQVASMLKELHCQKEGINFFKEFSRATHEAGWCKDPNCSSKQNKNHED